MIFTTVLLDCLKQTYQIFITAIFQDVSEDLIFFYDLISLFPSIITGFVRNLKIS